MGCRCAIATDEYHGWECSVTEGSCMFLVPNEKACYDTYGEGPLAMPECTEYALEHVREQELKDIIIADRGNHCKEE